MKINGREIKGPNVEIIVFPRPSFEREVVRDGLPVFKTDLDGNILKDDAGQPIPETETVSGDIPFKCQAVLDYSEFERLVPAVEPPKVLKRGETIGRSDTSDPTYRAAVHRRARLQTDWMILKSLEATPGLVWETIDFGKPETWHLYSEELAASGFTISEVNMLIRAAAIANSLNEERFEEAKARFLASFQAEHLTG